MINKKYRKMCEVYKIFAKDYDCDLSEEAMLEMYTFESTGKGSININGFNTIGKKPNGYAVGKKWLNVTVAMWFESMDKYGWLPEMKNLYNDPIFPHWWLDLVFKDFINKKDDFYRKRNITPYPIDLYNKMRKNV